MRVLFDGTITHESFGIFSSAKMQRYVIFDQGVEGLCGFKEFSEAFESNGTEYVEVGLFMELLYQGYPVPYLVINTDKDFIETVDDTFLPVMAGLGDPAVRLPITKDMVQFNCSNLAKFCGQKKKFPETDFYFETFIDKCILSELLRKVTISGKLELEKKDYIQSIADNRIKGKPLSQPECKKFIMANIKEAEKSLPHSPLREGLSRDEIHDYLLKIRGIREW